MKQFVTKFIEKFPLNFLLQLAPHLILTSFLPSFDFFFKLYICRRIVISSNRSYRWCWRILWPPFQSWRCRPRIQNPRARHLRLQQPSSHNHPRQLNYNSHRTILERVQLNGNRDLGKEGRNSRRWFGSSRQRARSGRSRSLPFRKRTRTNQLPMPIIQTIVNDASFSLENNKQHS